MCVCVCVSSNRLNKSASSSLVLNNTQYSAEGFFLATFTVIAFQNDPFKSSDLWPQLVPHCARREHIYRQQIRLPAERESQPASLPAHRRKRAVVG